MRSAATMRSSPAMTGKSTMTGKPAAYTCPTGKTAAPGETAPVKTTTRNSTIPIPTVHIPTVHIPTIDETAAPINGRGPTASTIPGPKPTIVKTTTGKISGIPSLKERPIMGIVIVIPIVTIPGRIVVIRIPREIGFTHYPGSSRIIVLILIHGWSRRRRRCIIFLRVALDGNQAGPENGHERK